MYGRALDWPFEYDVLRPYYDQVQTDVGISGDAEAEIWRPPGAPYPLPPILVNEHGLAFAKGFEAKGVTILAEKKSLLYLIGTTLEYQGGLNGKGFQFNNPNASRTCGCGESFTV